MGVKTRLVRVETKLENRLNSWELPVEALELTRKYVKGGALDHLIRQNEERYREVYRGLLEERGRRPLNQEEQKSFSILKLGLTLFSCEGDTPPQVSYE